MGEYTQSFKEAIVKKLGGPDAKSATELAQAVGVSQSTLSRWLRVGPIAKNGLIDVRDRTGLCVGLPSCGGPGVLQLTGRTGQPAAGSPDSVSSGFQTRSNP